MNKIKEYFEVRANLSEREEEILSLAHTRLAKIQALLKPLSRGGSCSDATVLDFYVNNSFKYAECEIQWDRVIFSEEINMSCHCHPEYVTLTQDLDMKYIVSSEEEFEKDIRALYESEKSRIDELDKKQAEKELAEKNAQELKRLEQEKAQYELLKKKFANSFDNT